MYLLVDAWCLNLTLCMSVCVCESWCGLTSFLPPWPLTPAVSPGEFLACSIRAFSCWTLLSSVFASSSRYSQVFFCPSLTAGPAPPTGETSSPLTNPADGDAAADTVILAWTGWGTTASAGNAVRTERDEERCRGVILCLERCNTLDMARNWR